LFLPLAGTATTIGVIDWNNNGSDGRPAYSDRNHQAERKKNLLHGSFSFLALAAATIGMSRRCHAHLGFMSRHEHRNKHSGCNDDHDEDGIDSMMRFHLVPVLFNGSLDGKPSPPYAM
jgi:hypothetical protein